MTKDEAIELDQALDLFIGKTIYYLENKIYSDFNSCEINERIINAGFKFKYLRLENLYDYVYKEPKNNPERLFIMLIDFKISLAEVFEKYCKFSWINNSIIAAPEEYGLKKYATKIEAHSICVDFILTYRALWDKIMGILVFVYYSYEEYEKFIQRKSRKAAFKKLFSEHKVWTKIDRYFSALALFDDKYRTPEAHLSGSARTTTIFSSEIYMRSEYHINLLDEYFNPLNAFINIFGQLLNYAKYGEKKYLETVVI